jgi:hypothetical protein
LREIAPEWDAVYFVPLAALFDADLLFVAVRDALQLSAVPDSAPLEQIERALRGKRALLLLDNFEQLVAGGAAHLQSLRERLLDVTFVISAFCCNCLENANFPLRHFPRRCKIRRPIAWAIAPASRCLVTAPGVSGSGDK